MGISHTQKKNRPLLDKEGTITIIAAGNYCKGGRWTLALITRVLQIMSIFKTMRNEPIINRKYLRDTRNELRNNQTPAEQALWALIKNKQLSGRKFRRQVSIENYIVDFYCPEEKLVIELDGSVHNHPQIAENDQYRDERLTDLGFTVLRFENSDVFKLQEWVLDEISKHFKK